MAYINGKKVLTAIKTVMAPASLQEKRITPTTFEREVVADSGYDGLSKVKINGVLVDTHQTLESNQDGSVAYTKTVPTGALPYASIDMLGGMSYKYNEDITNANVTSIDSIGVNIWDEEYEINKSLNILGEVVSENGSFVSKNFIPVFEKTKYYFVSPSTLTVCWYDINKNFINTNYPNNTNGRLITSPINASFIKFSPYNYGTTYKNDICINVSNDAINGTYFPYKHNNFPIPSSIQSLEGYGWGVNDSCYNYIDFERKKFVKKVGRVDLGTLNWDRMEYPTGSSIYLFYSINTTQKYNTTNYNCSKYEVKEALPLYTDKCITGHGGAGTSIWIRDDSYTDATTFKTAMSGVYLYYELATPVITDLSNILTDDNFIEVEANGTLTFENTNKKAVPSKIAYLVEVK